MENKMPDFSQYRDKLSPELIEKIRECKSMDELLKLAEEENIELTDEQLESVAGGWCPTECDIEACPLLGCHQNCIRDTCSGYTPTPVYPCVNHDPINCPIQKPLEEGIKNIIDIIWKNTH